MTRREALYATLAGMFAAAHPSAQDASLDFVAIDHVEFYVSQVERTRDFFAAVFGNTILKNTSASKDYVRIGSSYMAFERPRTAGGPLVTDHVSVAISNIDMARVHALLDSRGIAYRDYPSGRDTAVVDGEIFNKSLTIEQNALFEGVARRLDKPVTPPSSAQVKGEEIVPALSPQTAPLLADTGR